jgi:hypothetical protein
MRRSKGQRRNGSAWAKSGEAQYSFERSGEDDLAKLVGQIREKTH